MPSLPALAQPHVPAWKRVGLKLKYAKDRPSTLHGTYPAAESVTETKFNLEGADDISNILESDAVKPRNSKQNKRPHEGPDKASLPSKRCAYNAFKPDTITSSEPIPSSSSPQASKAASKGRKSVSFTPETKTEDGDSTRELFAQWVTEQKAADPSFTPRQSASALNPGTAASDLFTSAQFDQPPGVKKPKKPKLKKRSEVASSEASQFSTDKLPIAPALNYLTAFTDSSSGWKFSKNHQNYLLKHLFDLDKIPDFYDTAIYKYLLGLKGASSRQRIRSTALQKRKDNEMWLSDLLSAELGDDEMGRKRKREAYERAWKREKERSKDLEHEKEERDREKKRWELKGKQYTDWEKRVLERKRAETVLWSVGEVENIDLTSEVHRDAKSGKISSPGVIADPKVNGARMVEGQIKAKRRRKRKRRTTGVPDDESSSSSDSESNSDEENVTTQAPVLKRVSDSDLVGKVSASAESEQSSSEIGSGSSSDSTDAGKSN